MTKICTKCKVEKPRSEFHKRPTKDGLRADCKACVNERSRSYHEYHREEICDRLRRYNAENKEALLAQKKAYYATHKELMSARSKAWRESNKEYLAAANKAWREANKAALSEKAKKWREDHREEISARRRLAWPSRKESYKAYCENNKERRAAVKKAWREANKPRIVAKQHAYNEANKEVIAERHKLWCRANPEKVRALVHKRRARRLSAEGYFTEADILALFEKQQGCCVYCCCDIHLKYHIDHILALARGGSNWPSNLQLTCPSCNTSKHTKTHEEFIAYRLMLGLIVNPTLLL